LTASPVNVPETFFVVEAAVVFVAVGVALAVGVADLVSAGAEVWLDAAVVEADADALAVALFVA
jgi:hypothetical protein